MNEQLELRFTKDEPVLPAVTILVPKAADGKAEWTPVSDGFPAYEEFEGQRYAKMLNLIVGVAGSKRTIPVTGIYNTTEQKFYGTEVRQGGMITLSPIEYPLYVTHWAELPMFPEEGEK